MLRKKLYSFFVTLFLIVPLLSGCVAHLTPLLQEYASVEPTVLELIGEEVPAHITLRIPAQWMKKNVSLQLIPTLRYKGGEVWGKTLMLQGEEAEGEGIVIPFDREQNISLMTSFPYDSRMRESTLYLTLKEYVDGRATELPPLKIAEGVQATVTWATLDIPHLFPQPVLPQESSLFSLLDEINQKILSAIPRTEWRGWVSVTGRSNADLLRMAQEKPEQLSLDELLHSAFLAPILSEKERIYRWIATYYPQDSRAFNALISLSIRQEQWQEATTWIEKSRELSDTPEGSFYQALLYLREDKIALAQNLINKLPESLQTPLLPYLYLKQGRYQEASDLYGTEASHNAVIAQILTAQYGQAMATLHEVEQSNATTDYLKAVVAMRMQDANAALNFLAEAIRRNPNFASLARSDKEFAPLVYYARFNQLTR